MGDKMNQTNRNLSDNHSRLVSFHPIYTHSPFSNSPVQLLSEPPLPQWWGNIEKKIIELYSLENNWDTYGAKKLEYKVLYDSIIFLKEPMFYAPEPRVIPISNGSVQYEWRKGDRELVINFKNKDEISIYYFDESAAEEYDFSFYNDQKLAKNLFKRIIGNNAE